MTKKPFNVVLTEVERAQLEAHRIALGLRAHADVVRHWITQPVQEAAPSPNLRRGLSLPVLPPIPEEVLLWSDLEWRKDEESGQRYHWYAGPIEPGMIFAWEPDAPTARELCIVTAITEPMELGVVQHAHGMAIISQGSETQIWSTPLDSPNRGKTSLPHRIARLLDHGPVPNDESRFREAVVPTTHERQTP